MEQILGFAPDAPWGTLNALRDCSCMIPYANGLQQAQPWGSVSSDALAAAPSYAGGFGETAPSTIVAAANSKLYRYLGPSWTDISRVAAYGGNHVSIVQFGAQTLACNGSGNDVIQSTSSVASVNFSDQATAPKAGILVSATTSGGGFVLAFDTYDAGFGTSPDRWWCCAVNDATSWTVSVATQATSGRLLNGTGGIVAAANLSGDTVVAFKKDTMFVGRYVGPPSVWQWQEIIGYGCLGRNAVCSINGGVFFASKDGLFIYDGSQVTPIGKGAIFEWWRNSVSARNPSYRSSTFCQFDKFRNQVRLWYGSSLYVDKCLVISLDKFNCGFDTPPAANGRLSVPIYNYDTGSADYLYTIADDFKIYRQATGYAGGASASSITSGYVGNDQVVSDLNGFLLRYELKPKTSVTAASCIPYAYQESGGAETALASTNAMDSPKGASSIFQTRANGRWFSGKFNFAAASGVTEYAKVIGIKAEIVGRGKR